jgi:zinc transport system substrate-binding protein
MRALCAAFLLVAALASFTSATEPSAKPKKLRVITTILPVYCFASGVIGSEGEVINLLPANVEPHDYQLSPNDLRKIKDADLVIFNGAGLDNWVIKALATADHARALDLSANFKGELIDTPGDVQMNGAHKHSHDHDHSPGNPHFWLDPQMAIRCVTNILAVTLKIDSTRASNYTANADVYIARLKKLDEQIAQTLTGVREKPFVTQHDAFPYFIRRYHLRQVGVLEPTPDVPPSPRYLSDLLKVIREKHVPVIFTLSQESPRLAKQIAKDTKIRIAELNPLENGKSDPQAYENGMRENAIVMARELK